MNTEHLRYFSHVYELRSYRAAARQISITTTGLTKAIQSLEDQLHIELFDKDDRGNLTPTPYADALQQFCHNLESDFLLLRETFNRICAQQHNLIRFGSCQGMWGLMGPSFLADLNRQHPNITLAYNEYTDYDCEQGLLSERFDLAFTVAPYHPHLVTTELFEDQVCFWVPASFELAHRSHLNIADLRGCNVAIPGAGYKVYTALMQRCDTEGVPLGTIYETSELYRIFDYVAKGHGIGFTLKAVSELELFKRHPEVRCVPSADLLLRFGISYLPYHSLTEPEQRFYHFCYTYARERFGRERTGAP